MWFQMTVPYSPGGIVTSSTAPLSSAASSSTELLYAQGRSMSSSQTVYTPAVTSHAEFGVDDQVQPSRHCLAVFILQKRLNFQTLLTICPSSVVTQLLLYCCNATASKLLPVKSSPLQFIDTKQTATSTGDTSEATL